MDKKAHFVTFYSPGTFVSEEITKKIKSWNVKLAKQIAKKISVGYNSTPYGFSFHTRERKVNDLDSHITKRSTMYYLGGEVKTLKQIKERKNKNDKTLIANMECNKWNKVIINTNSWKIILPLKSKDVVLSWP